MNKILNKVKKMIPPENENYNYVKKIKLGYPMIKVKLKILRREDKCIPYTYEAILKLLRLGINNVNQISLILGIEEYVLYNLLADMSSQNYIYMLGSENPIISKQGKELLNTLKMIEITEDEIDFVVNGVTGQIEEDIQVNCGSSKTILKELVKVNEDFLNTKFKEINDIYIKSQEEYFEEIGGHSIYELYDIRKIKNKFIFYKYYDVYIYEKEGDLDIQFKKEMENSDEYMKILLNQYTTKPSIIGIENRIYNIIPKDYLAKYKDELKENYEKMILAVKNNNEDEFKQMYYSDRKILEDEYFMILIEKTKNCKIELDIKTGNIHKIIQNEEVLNSIINISKSKANVKIILGKNQIAKSDFEKIKQMKCAGAEFIQAEYYINDTIIIFDKKCAIYTNYEYIKINHNIPNLKMQLDNTNIIYDEEMLAKLEECLKI